jgi:hypothetical protein
MSIRKLSGLLALLLWSSVGNAQAIFVQNHDFEAPVLSPASFTLGVLPGWSGPAGANWGAFHPTVASWGYTAPSGNQVFYSNGLYAQQVLGELAVAGRSYYLVVDVVNRPTYGSLDYDIELWAGATLLASDYGSLEPPVGGSLESRLFVTVGSGSPAVGQPLAIRLGGGGNQVNFDDVRLLPEPGLTSGFGAVVALAGWVGWWGRARPPGAIVNTDRSHPSG